MDRLPPRHIPHILRLAAAILPAALALSFATAGSALATIELGCGVSDSCGVTEVGATSVVLDPTIEANGSETGYRLEYATAESGPWAPVPGGSGVVTAAEGKKTLHVELTHLTPETTYDVRVVAQNAAGTLDEIPITFTTESVTPRAVGTTVLGTTETSAEVQGQLKPHLETQWRLEYATVESGPWSTFAAGTLAASDKLQTTPARALTGLSPGTTYYVREFLTNEHGEATSQPTSFATAAPPVATPPSVASESATSITQTDATLGAQINSEGLETSYRFQIAKSPACLPPPVGYMPCAQVEVGALPSGGTAGGLEDQSVSLDLASVGITLQPGATYYYRVVATSSAGESKGPAHTFTTLSETTPPKTPEEPAPKGFEEPLSPAVSSVLPSSALATVAPSSPPGGRTITSPKSSTTGQKLAGALRACEKRPEKQRAACRKQAYKTYAKAAGRDTGKKASEQQHRR